MRKLKHNLTIAMIVMLAVVFMPILPGVNGEAKADVNVAEINDNQYATVQKAVNNATEGQTVKMIADSNENVSIPSDKNIILDLNDHVLTGTGTGSTVTVKSDGTLKITDNSQNKTTRYFTDEDGDGCFEKLSTESPASVTDFITATGGVITGGCAANGGGINNKGTLDVEKINIIGNKAYTENGTYLRGGGVYSAGTKLTVQQANISGNSAICIIIGKDSETGTVNGKARAQGGGIYNQSTSTELKNTTISRNSSIAKDECVKAYGGGLFQAGAASIESCTFEKNKVTASGTLAVENEAQSANAYGGGIYTSSTVKLEKSSVKNNEIKVTTEKCGENVRYAFGGGICITTNGNLTIADEDCIISGNTADSTYKTQGGGVYMASSSEFTMTAGTIKENTVKAYKDDTVNEEEGGGVCVTYSTSKFTVGGTAKITGNTGSDSSKSNVYLRKPGENEAQVAISTDTAPVAGMSIGITLADNQIGTIAETVSQDYTQYFSSDNSTCYVKHVDGKLELRRNFDDRFGGINLTKDSYVKDEVPTQDCHAKTQGYTFAGWSTEIDNAEKIVTTDTYDEKTTYYAVWKNSTTNKIVVTQPMNLNRALPETDKLTDYGYKYEAGSESGSTLELTLDDFTMDVCDASGNNYAAMQINRNSEINIEGKNNIYVDSNGNGATGIYTKYTGEGSTDKVTIETSKGEGLGTLNIKTEASGENMTGLAGIHIEGPALEIKNVTIHAKAGELKNIASSDVNCYGILVNSENADALTINRAKVTAEAGDSTGSSCGISAQRSNSGGNISILNDAKVSATSGNAANDSIAMLAYGDVAVDNSSVKAADLLQQGIVSTGGDIEINNSSVQAAYSESSSFDEDNGKGYGIYAQNGDIDITGSKTDIDVKGGLIGIIAKGSDGEADLNIKNGRIRVDVAKEGLWAKTKLNMEAGKVYATAHGSTASGGAKAIYSQGTISIGNADVTAQCTDTSLETSMVRYGIRAKDTITVTNPEKLIVKGVTAAFNINDGTSDKNLVTDTDLVGYTNVDATEGETTLTPAEGTGIIDLNGDTYKCVRTKEAEPAPTPTPATKYTVTFDNQGHGVVPQSQAIEEGGKVSDPGSLEAEGFIFGGWFADKDCTTAWDFDNDTVTKNITLYAKWTEKTAIEDCEIVLSNEVYVFNNKVQIPNVTLTDPSGNILEEDRDYTFELEDSKNVGTYAVTVNGIGAYKGSGQASYKINPASKAIKKVNAGKKKLTVKWKKSSKTYRAQTTGYQIRYSTSKSFKKYKTKKVSRNAASKTIKNLKAHKKYYVKMRRYKVVDGQKYYSTWSKVKTKKTK